MHSVGTSGLVCVVGLRPLIHTAASARWARRDPDFSNRFNGFEWVELDASMQTVKTVPGIEAHFTSG